MSTEARALASRAGLNYDALDGFLPSKVDEPLTQFDFHRSLLILKRIAENDVEPLGEWQPLTSMPREGEFWLKRRRWRSSPGRKTVYRVRWTKSGNLVTVQRCDPIKLTSFIGWQP